MKYFIVASALLVSACGRPTASDTDNIFGPDNREVTQDSAPYRAIGRLDSGCTGTLVAKNLVLTAAHCVFDSATQTVKPAVKYFRPNLRSGKSSKPSWVNFLWIGSKNPESERVNDWAFLRLDDPLGAEFGTLPIHSVDFAAQLPYTVSLVGYSSDKNNGGDQNIHRGCYVMKVVDGKLFHECDATAGISGAPLLSTVNGNQYVVGVTVSEYRQGAPNSVTREHYSDDYANVAVPASQFAELSTQLIGAVDGGTTLPSFDQTHELVNPNSRTEPDQPDEPNDPNGPNGPNDPNDPNDANGPGGPDQPGLPDLAPEEIASPEVILQRAQTIFLRLDQLAGAVRYFRDLSHRVGCRDVLIETPRILGDVDRFARLVRDIVNGDYRRADHTGPLIDTYQPLISDVEFYRSLDAGLVPGPFVQQFEKVRGDIEQLVLDLRVLIAQ